MKFDWLELHALIWESLLRLDLTCIFVEKHTTFFNHFLNSEDFIELIDLKFCVMFAFLSALFLAKTPVGWNI